MRYRLHTQCTRHFCRYLIQSHNVLSEKGLWIGIKIHTYLNTPPSAMNCQLQSAALQEDSVIAIQSLKAKHSRTFDNIREHSKLSDKLALRDML